MNQSRDYHDYVIVDGKLIGKFEEMYQHSEAIPWRQDQQESWIDVKLTLELLKSENRFDGVIDYGCGLGHYLDILCRNLNIKTGIGFDISKTAVEKATTAFPGYTFIESDLTNVNSEILAHIPKGRNLHIIRGTLWYVYQHIETVVANLTLRLGENDLLVIVQNFPKLTSNFVGKDVIPNYDAIVRFFTKTDITLESMIWYQKEVLNKNDSWFIGCFIKSNNI